ncbi:uncharacterized protein LOC110464518 [Mizuhopecten yessoensis]|uniref:Tripartite motif-containing protein 3 n=1 Tax=Mizuhopecten yessoensis TaxID=6573 RepID=A0A210PTT9_MIZYE|nr:uncharacterized protein LOC110464518 [Mizuhopecten yessoensis]XP_021375446.1 uncharacterized protein LOC110464518 [Mizuhopecten yessoensis]OWF39872.1 Tripartite motif-containing protein 3 [Mizuhopecten yessoensis]
MAEGGPSLVSPPVDSTPHGLLDSHLLDCPICLEQLRKPKCLPCLHSLCEDCLSSYIVKEVSGTSDTASSFTCPVCRKLTHPHDNSEDTENWAKQFPIDSHAVEMIQIANQTTEPYHCKPCQKKGDRTPAHFWCKATKSLFCKSCKDDCHDILHTECDPVDISKSGRFHLKHQGTSDRRCHQHHKRNHYYCEDHKSLGCSKCMVADHKSCKHVSSIEDFCNKVESTCRLDKIRNALQQGVDALKPLIQDFYLQLQSIADDKDMAFKGIDDLQEQINKCIAEMKRETTDELVSAYKKEQEQLKKSSQKCERLRVAMQNTLESSAAAQQQKDLPNTVLLYQRGQAEVESCKNLVDELIRKFSTTKIDFEIHSNVSNVTAVSSLGKVVVRKKDRNVPGGLDVFYKPLFGRKMKEIRKTYIKCPSDTKDCCILGVVNLPDGQMIVSDFSNRKLKLISSDGNVVNELKMNGKPRVLCLVDSMTVAAATENPEGICAVTVGPSSLTLFTEINTGQPCYGIAYRDGEFVVSTGYEVCSMSKDGTTHMLHGYGDMVLGMSYDSQHGQLFITHNTDTPGRTVVRSLSDDNNNTDVLEVGVVRQAFGVDVDEQGNAYVCGYGSNNVVQMSGDGTNIRELLTEADGINQPRAISVCGDKIVVTNDSSEQMNFITLFQLA